MITAFSFYGKNLVLRNTSKPNIYPIDSASIVIGTPNSGKTTLLRELASSALGRNSKNDQITIEPQENVSDIGVIYYNPNPFDCKIPGHPNLIDISKSIKADPQSLLIHKEALVSFGLELDKGNSGFSGTQQGLIAFFNAIENSVNALSKKTSIIIILDNADAGLHPLDQRCFVYALTQFLASCKAAYRAASIQLVLASNSPLVASDFPSEYSCILSEDYWKQISDTCDQEQFFAASISKVFNLGMNASTIPEFATQTINSTIASIQSGTRSELDKYVISVIGDPIIKRSVEDM